MPTIEELNRKIEELTLEKRVLEMEKEIERLKKEIEAIKANPYQGNPIWVYPSVPFTPGEPTTIKPWPFSPTITFECFTDSTSNATP